MCRGSAPDDLLREMKDKAERRFPRVLAGDGLED
jgi:hypothetical protein